MKNKTFRVVMLATKKANPDYIIFFRTRDVYGKLIDRPCLEASSNKTFIRNVDLINQGRAETNAQDKYEFQNLYVISNEEIKEGDWCLGGDRIFHNTVQLDAYINIYKIVASTDKSLKETVSYDTDGKTPNGYAAIPTIPESFVNAYIEAYNENKPITEIDLEMEEFSRQVPSITRIKTRSDGSIINHESKMYSREDVKKLIYEFSTKVFSEKFEADDTNKWIEEHLK